MTRKEAIERIKARFYPSHVGLITNETLEDAKALRMAIEALSERTGEWILECDSEGEGDNLYRCSECGCHYGCQEYDKPNFCPNCGKQMLRKDDETE